MDFSNNGPTISAQSLEEIGSTRALDRRGAQSSKQLAQKLLLLAKAKGLAQVKLAKGIGILPANLNVFLRGKRDISSRHFVNLLRELGLDLDQAVNLEIGRHTNIKIQEPQPLAVAIDSILGALPAIDRRTLISHMVRVAKLNLGPDAARDIDVLKSRLK